MNLEQGRSPSKYSSGVQKARPIFAANLRSQQEKSFFAPAKGGDVCVRKGVGDVHMC